MSRRAEKKKSESELLAEETLKMEAKLRVLKAEVTRQRLEADVPRTNSGSRWRAGAADIGSVTRYDKDVDERIKQQPQRPASKMASPAEAAQPALRRPASSRRPLRPEEAASWSVDDVKKWLSNLGLDAYTPAFAENAISGEVLLELGVEDLDYMKITVLGHRKLLLKGVEQLKAAIHPSAPVEVAMSLRPGGAAASTPAPLLAAEQPDSSLWVNPFESMSTAPAPQRRDEVLTAISSVTLADKPAPTSLWDGEYNEEAERRAFQAAVAAWRGTGKPASDGASAAVEPASPVPPAAASGGGTLLQGQLDEAAEAKAFQEAVASWRAGASDATKVSCYTCYRVFVPSTSASTRAGKSFCSSSCQASHESAEAERAKRLQETTQKLQEEVAVASVQSTAEPSDGVDDVGANLSEWDHTEPSAHVPKDYSDIWSLPVEF